MAITTLNGLIAGARPPEDILKVGGTMEAAGVWHSLAYSSGAPGAAAAPTAALAGTALTSYAGQIPFTNPAGGLSTYMTRLVAAANNSGGLRVYDRLWHNGTIAVTNVAAQTIGSPTLPARDRAGTTNGEGVLCAIEVSTATTNAAAITNMTISYTNSAGTAGRTGTIASFPATAAAGTWVPFQLQAGDTGVRSVQTLTLGTSLTAGTVHLVLYRTLLTLGISPSNNVTELNAITGGMPQCYDNTVPFMLWMPSATTATTVNAQLAYAQG
ncbi:MAG: hypothetical protein ACRCZP_00495 [Phycicoccus sp.]